MKLILDLFHTIFTKDIFELGARHVKSVSVETEDDSYDWWFWY